MVVVIVVVVTYPLAVRAGKSLADADIHAVTSSLPTVERLVTTKEEFSAPTTNYRLLIIDSNFVLVFTPLDPSDVAVIPHITRFAKGDVYVLETNR
jgi:hypothetical protein